MKTNGEQGQISIEFVLILGAVLTMTVVAIPMVLKNAEMNRGLAAARDGATFGAGMRGLGFSSGGGNTAGMVKIINMTPERQAPVGDLDWYRLRFYISAPSSLIDNPTCVSSSVGSTITNQALRYVHYSFNGEWLNLVSRVNGSYYSFTAACTFV